MVDVSRPGHHCEACAMDADDVMLRESLPKEDRSNLLLRDAWAVLREAGFYGHDTSTLADGIRWLAAKVATETT